jgi:hypothetical protein
MLQNILFSQHNISGSKLRVESIPESVVEEITEIALGQCVHLDSRESLIDYLLADEDALELALPYLEDCRL